jgi:hypothetical protein
MTTSITKLGKFEPFGLQVAEGAVGFHSVLHIFGFNADIDTGVEEAIWPAGGPIPYLSSPVAMKVSSSSANDAAAGTGARTVFIKGINGTGSETSETITLNGQTEVVTTNTYSFIQQVTVMTVGSGGKNAGNIYVGTGTVTAGVPAVVYGIAATGENNSLTGAWVCPTGYTGYITKGSIATGTENGSNYIVGRLKVMESNGLERTAAIVTFANGDYGYDFDYPVKITAGQRVTALATSTADNEAVSSYFQIVVVKDTP